nr:hypothetical protein [Nitrospirota bacterium]
MPSNAQRIKTWGMYTYIAGDNNLSDFGLRDIEEMSEAGASENVYVSVQIDTEGDHTGSIRYEISEPDFEGKSHRTVIQRLPEQNTGEPRYLAAYAGWAAKRYPAKNRLLVVWNHGAGFMHTPTRDIAYDDSSHGDALTMGELRWALEKAGFGGGAIGKLGILGFDACLMNMVEVAYEFKGLADFVVGSQQTEPGDGWPYRDVILGAQSSGDPKVVAKAIVQAYIAHYKSTGDLGVTQSALDLNKFPTVGGAVDRLAKTLASVAGTKKGAILEARVATQGYEEPTYVDLVDLAKNLSSKVPDAKVRAACRAIPAAVRQVVVANGTFGPSVSRSAGLSVWFPLLRTDYVTRRSEYVALRYSKDYPNWADFLDRLVAV